MADSSNIRITFNCPDSLKDRLTNQANKEGIPRSQLIVEILENSLGTLPSLFKILKLIVIYQ